MVLTQHFCFHFEYVCSAYLLTFQTTMFGPNQINKCKMNDLCHLISKKYQGMYLSNLNLLVAILTFFIQHVQTVCSVERFVDSPLKANV